MNKKKYQDEFKKWNDITGAIPEGSSWYSEVLSIFESADKEIKEIREVATRSIRDLTVDPYEDIGL